MVEPGADGVAGRYIDTSKDNFVASMISLHPCMACSEVCDCTEGETDCVGCAECQEFYLHGGAVMGPSPLERVIDAEFEEVPRLPSETERENWCCGADHYPFHYIDCPQCPGLGVKLLRRGREYDD